MTIRPAGINSTDNEKMSAEAADAILWSSRGMDEPDVDWPADRTDAERIVAAVLAVFEKAHTPTDDEREALIEWHAEQAELLRPFRRSSSHLKAAMLHAQTVQMLRTLRNVAKDYDTNFPCDGGCNTNDGPEETCSRHGRSPRDLWNLLDAARRSEVPEPSADDKIEWPDHWTINDKLRDLHARWHDQKGNLLGREACGWERCEFWDSAQFTLRLADVHIAGRAALRAAGGVR